MNAPRTLREALVYFNDFENCQRFMIDLRWPDGKVRCPHCQSDKVTYLPSGRVWRCAVKHPLQKFSLKLGTVLEDSPIGLEKWLPAMWLIANAKNGISSWELHRALGVTQKTAWFMLQRIRLAMQNQSIEKIVGDFEVDESFIGGSARFMHKDKKAKITGTGGTGGGKAVVMGLLDRKSKKFRLRHVADTSGPTLQGVVREYVQGGSYIYSDAWRSYNGLSADYVHQVIDHAEKYVDGNVHTNGIENFWSLLKRCLKGTYIAVEPFHLFRYLDEEAFRFNERKEDDATRFVKVASSIVGRRLTYEKLIGHIDPPAEPLPA
jgi:transposase-like protein